MHSFLPAAKGDPLCPLGFHPQVRWPTRCKRCFRDYKEHGGRKETDLSSTSSSLRRENAVTASTPSLTTSWSRSPTRDSGNDSDSGASSRSDLLRTNTSNDLSSSSSTSSTDSARGKTSSWTSTPDLNNLDEETTCVTVRIPLRVRPKASTEEDKPRENDRSNSQYTVRRRYTTDLSHISPPKEEKKERKSSDTASKSSGYSSRGKRITFSDDSSIKSGRSTNSSDVEFIFKVKNSNKNDTKPTSSIKSNSSSKKGKSYELHSSEDDDDDASSVTATSETTDTTIIDRSNEDEVAELKRELDTLRVRCEKLEREKSDILLRRLAGARDTAPSSGEALKLQQRVHELQQAVEDLRDEKHSLSLRVKELEEVTDIASQREPEMRRTIEDLRNKLSKTETYCEELMDENEDIKKELRDLEEEIDEMQDNFREDQANEYASLKKELDQTAKNCRVLQFKLKKSERLNESINSSKIELERQLGEKGLGTSSLEKIKSLEKDLKIQCEVSERLQKEIENLNSKLEKEKAAAAKAKTTTTPSTSTATKKAPPMTRASLTRGGSQDDPVQLLRDLQDSMEREADLREQLRFAEEEIWGSFLQKVLMELGDFLPWFHDEGEEEIKHVEEIKSSSNIWVPMGLTPCLGGILTEPHRPCPSFADLLKPLNIGGKLKRIVVKIGVICSQAQNLRKKCSRIEDDNDSLSMQLKKMAKKARTRRQSPSPARMTPEPSAEKDEGISDDDDPAELRLQLDLNEQETAVLRRKVEDLEKAVELDKKQIKDLTEKLANSIKTPTSPTSPRTVRSDILRPATSSAAVLEKKITVLEEEASELRKKLIEKERDYERIQAELTIAQKRSSKSSMSRSRSLDSNNEQALDLKRQLQVIEQEASVLRTRNQELEATNDKLSSENKKLTLKAARTKATTSKDETKDDNNDLKEKINKLEKQLSEANNKISELQTNKKPTTLTEVEKLKNQLIKLEKENENLKAGGVRLRNRTAKKPTDLTTKLQLKNMVEDLEQEVAELLVGLNKKESKGSDVITKELDEIKKERDKLKLELEKNKNKNSEDEKAINSEKTKLQQDLTKIKTENKKLTDEIEKLKSSQGAVKDVKGEVIKLQKELEEAQVTITALKQQQNNDDITKLQNEKLKLEKEVSDKNKKLTDVEKKSKEIEEKLKKTERILSGKKGKLTKAEKELEAEREKVKQSEIMQKEVAVGWLRERDELKSNVTEIKRKSEQLQEQLSGRVREVEALEGSLASERAMVEQLKSTTESSKAATSAAAEKQLAAAREEIATAKSRATDLAAQLEKAEKAKKSADEKAKKDIKDLQAKLTESENNQKTEKQKLELSIKEKEQEIRTLNTQLKTAQQDANNKKAVEIQEEMNQKLKKLEKELKTEKQEYEELTARYELLEEEHVVTKAQLTMDREKVESALKVTQQEFITLDKELQTLRETYNNKQDTWIKEKLDMQEQLKELEQKLSRGGGNESEKNRLKTLLDDKNSELDKVKHDVEVMMDQVNYSRKESEELRKKLEDFDKVSKFQKSVTADTAALNTEITELRNRLQLEGINHKSDIAQLRMRYDGRVVKLTNEIQSLQNQMEKFKRERDSYRHMLDAAQKTIGDLKSNKTNKAMTSSTYSSSGDESEDTRMKIAALEQQITCMEDQLSDSKLEASKLKTELVSERSAWEVKISEMQSRLNELEEERLLTSGRKIPGMKTRLELAWHKEREEQHRLLQETSTLARDLRQTLFEVERERDKEKLEGKRKLDQLKKNMEEEMEENRKKITEMQCDLLELRDAHAKLRTTNENLRRERERLERDRKEFTQQNNMRKRMELEEERKVNSILEQVEDLMRLAPDLFPDKGTASGSSTLPIPPKRLKGPRSRESSPSMERKDYSREPSVGAEDRKQQLHTTLLRLTDATNELRKYQRMGEDEKDRERFKRTLGFRRAASTEAEPVSSETKSKTQSNGTKKGGLFRKALSLEQTGGMSQEQKIWTSEDGGSTSSLQSIDDPRFMSLQRRDPSVDRLSTDSTQSDLASDKKKKKGFLGKLKTLTKSRSIEDSNTGDMVINAGMQAGSIGGSGSDISTIDTINKKDNKKGSKLAGIFKKGSSVERSSVDREVVDDKNKSKSKPTVNDSPTSSASRPLAPNLAQQKPTTTTTINTNRRYVR